MRGLHRAKENEWNRLEIKCRHDDPFSNRKDPEMLLPSGKTFLGHCNQNAQWTETDSQTQKTHLWSPKGEGGGGGINQEFEIIRYTLLYAKKITRKILLIA